MHAHPHVSKEICLPQRKFQKYCVFLRE
jgi:hypothetical protein